MVQIERVSFGLLEEVDDFAILMGTFTESRCD